MPPPMLMETAAQHSLYSQLPLNVLCFLFCVNLPFTFSAQVSCLKSTRLYDGYFLNSSFGRCPCWAPPSARLLWWITSTAISVLFVRDETKRLHRLTGGVRSQAAAQREKVGGGTSNTKPHCRWQPQTWILLITIKGKRQLMPHHHITLEINCLVNFKITTK